MTNSPQRETQLFDLAFAIPPAERRALLERECAGDTELRDRVLALLEAADASGGFLETPPTLLSGVWAAHGVSTDAVPARVGP